MSMGKFLLSWFFFLSFHVNLLLLRMLKIEDDQSAENFANFTVDDMADIDVFDARDEMLEKMRRVKEGVTGKWHKAKSTRMLLLLLTHIIYLPFHFF